MNTNKFVVVIAFFVAASLGFAQGMRGTGGGGMAGQPIDGTAIFPSSVTSSGAITGDTLTATTTSTDAIYLNSGRPICMNAPTCNAASRLFYNGAQIQVGGGFLATGTSAATANFNSSTASGNQAFTCNNVGCRLSLGNTGRYFFDSGVSMRFTGGNFDFAQDNGQVNISGADAVLGVHSRIDEFNGSRPVLITGGKQTSAADSIGIRLRTRAQSVAGAKVVTFEDVNQGVVGFVDYLGNTSATTFTATTASGSALTGGGASGPLLVTSNTPDSHTSTTVPAILVKTANALASGDAIFGVQSSGGADEFRVRGGNGTGANAQAVVGAGVGRVSAGILTNFSGELALETWRTAASNVTGVSIGSFNALTGDQTKVLSIRNGSNFGTEVAAFSKDGLLRVNSANAAKPTCNADNRGRIFFLDGASTVADIAEICMKGTADTYAWQALATAP